MFATALFVIYAMAFSLNYAALTLLSAAPKDSWIRSGAALDLLARLNPSQRCLIAAVSPLFWEVPMATYFLLSMP